MKKIIFVALCSASVIFFGCKQPGSGDPKAVLSQFFEALSKKDITTARKLATSESQSMIDMMEMGMKMDNDSKETEKFMKSNMQFGEAKIDGNMATIPVKETSSGETLNCTLKKENGAWKVAFDKASMISMGMEKIKEKGINPRDSINKAMQELKNLNMDSLKNGMAEGMRVLDSVNKAMQKIQNP